MAQSEGRKLGRKYAAEWGLSIFFESANEAYGFMSPALNDYLTKKITGDAYWPAMQSEEEIPRGVRYVYMPEEAFLSRLRDGKTVIDFVEFYDNCMATPPDRTPWLEKIRYRKILRKQWDLQPNRCITTADVHSSRVTLVTRWFETLTPYYKNYKLACDSFFPGTMELATAVLERSIDLLSIRDVELGGSGLAAMQAAINRFKGGGRKKPVKQIETEYAPPKKPVRQIEAEYASPKEGRAKERREKPAVRQLDADHLEHLREVITRGQEKQRTAKREAAKREEELARQREAEQASAKKYHASLMARLKEGKEGRFHGPVIEDNTVELKLKDGMVTIELLPRLAPNHVARVKELVEQRFYDGIVFHRVIQDFMAQTGDPTGTGTGGSGQYLNAEFSDEKHLRGTISMARAADPNSADSQFFIVFKASPWLDGQYTIFGQVTGGMDAVDRIKKGAPGSGAVDGPDSIISMRIARDST
jgi:peptidylprolyl isomerase